MFNMNSNDQAIAIACDLRYRICKDALCEEVVEDPETIEVNTTSLKVKAKQEIDSEVLYVNLNYT